MVVSSPACAPVCGAPSDISDRIEFSASGGRPDREESPIVAVGNKVRASVGVLPPGLTGGPPGPAQ